MAHKAFHVFQYSSNSPGFAYSGDSQWYIEASANWFAAIENPGQITDFLEAGSLVRLPQVALWPSSDDEYTFEVIGETQGSYGDPSFFQGMVMIQNAIWGNSFHKLDMINDLEGSLTPYITLSDTTAYFIIASMPAVFQNVELTYPYDMRITKGDHTWIKDIITAAATKRITGRYNLMGQKTGEKDQGIQIIRYSDGTAAKVVNLPVR